MKLRRSMRGAGDAAAPEGRGAKTEVATVFLHQEIGGNLRDAEQRMGRIVNRHRFVDALIGRVF